MKKAILIAGVVVFAGSIAFWLFAGPTYRQYKEKRSLAQTMRFLAKGDYRNASLSARQTLQANPRNLEACRVMAELAERARSPHLLDWLRRIMELSPTIENKLSLASAALRSQGPPYPLASQMLQDLRTAGKAVAAYHVLAAELALKLHNFLEARAQFEEAAHLEPSNDLHQVNLAVVRLQSTNPTESADARVTLERLRSSTNVGVMALRWLVAETFQKRELSEAEKFSQELLSDSRADLEDRLQHLSILREANSPALHSCLEGVQTRSAANAAEVYGIASWMAGHGFAEDAIRWLTNCPAKVQAEQPVALAFVECYIARKDWRGLESFLQTGQWMDLEFLRKAFLSRAAAEQKQSLAAETRWRSAVREAGERLGPLLMLLRLAHSWGRDKAKEDSLWQIAQHFPRERWAAADLGRLYQSTGNTRGLNKVSALLASCDATNFEAQNNLAATSLLLKIDVPHANELAREMYLKHGEQPIIASTYAFSLFLQGHTREALDAFAKFKTEDLESPPIALYYGVFLSANGETNKAVKYLEIARGKATAFLPEERALMAKVGDPLFQ